MTPSNLDRPEEPFTRATRDWDIEKLYSDLANAKQEFAPHTRRGLTPVEKRHLCGLLCGCSPAEIAALLNKQIKGVEVDLSKTLYRYIETLTNRPRNALKNWRDAIDWLDIAGYKKQRKTLSGATLKATLQHSDSILSAAISPDGQLLATGSHDSTVKVWSLHSGELLRTICGHSTAVLLVAFSPASKTLLTRSRAGTVKLWNLQNGELLKRLAEVHRHESVAVSPDWQILAIGTTRGTVKLQHLNSGQLLQVLEGYQGDDISAIALSPNGKMLVASGLNAASGFCRATVTLWELPGGEVRRTFGSENYVAITPDSQILVSYGYKNLALWNLQTGELLHSMETGIRITSAAISPDGKYFAVGCFDGTVRLWNLGGELLQSLEGNSGPVSALAIGLLGETLVSGSENGTVKLWQLRI
ncbi:WD40 repeat domain-containing protein [Tychonema sp. LEGE 07199]|uniref:WD40 repeat domain-containing protein n=1 Tax=unclassified Tychonema TaxID=2642144 RepID=UPI0018815976|nr:MULTISPECIES: WD40 repeat domain-containing protein [unclassified Tychonema]MBE9124363.1 WD40 repeat domain-containing protein [Tychonema sp. LEGE 07199]MBE9135466.1 WD40 repeat domain-containing protein [Tychonema sp. LEGE 07196]